MAERVLARKDSPEPDVLLVTITAAGRTLGISRSSAYRMVEDGELPVIDVARKGAKRAKLRVPVREIHALIDRRTEAMAS